MITFAGRHFVPILPFGNSSAESPFSPAGVQGL